MADQSLADCVVFVPARNAAQAGLSGKVRSLGGEAVARWSKEVTHVVWSAGANTDEELRGLWQKADQMEWRPLFVSPLWIQQTAELGRRAMERHYAVYVPGARILKLSKSPAIGSAGKRRRAGSKGGPRKPRATDHLTLDDELYNSSQQIQAAAAARDAEDTAASPLMAPPPAKRARGAAPSAQPPAPSTAVAQLPTEEEACADELSPFCTQAYGLQARVAQVKAAASSRASAPNALGDIGNTTAAPPPPQQGRPPRATPPQARDVVRLPRLPTNADEPQQGGGIAFGRRASGPQPTPLTGGRRGGAAATTAAGAAKPPTPPAHAVTAGDTDFLTPGVGGGGSRAQLVLPGSAGVPPPSAAAGAGKLSSLAGRRSTSSKPGSGRRRGSVSQTLEEQAPQAHGLSPGVGAGGSIVVPSSMGPQHGLDEQHDDSFGGFAVLGGGTRGQPGGTPALARASLRARTPAGQGGSTAAPGGQAAREAGGGSAATGSTGRRYPRRSSSAAAPGGVGAFGSPAAWEQLGAAAGEQQAAHQLNGAQRGSASAAGGAPSDGPQGSHASLQAALDAAAGAGSAPRAPPAAPWPQDAVPASPLDKAGGSFPPGPVFDEDLVIDDEGRAASLEPADHQQQPAAAQQPFRLHAPATGQKPGRAAKAAAVKGSTGAAAQAAAGRGKRKRGVADADAGTPEVAALSGVAKPKPGAASRPGAPAQQQRQPDQSEQPPPAKRQKQAASAAAKAKAGPPAPSASGSSARAATSSRAGAGSADAGPSTSQAHTGAGAIGAPRYLACSSLPGGTQELAKSAVKQLPGGFRMCVEGHEEGRVTHLVMGSERRTLKVLLAMANGAWLLTPEWLTASLEQGRWLTEAAYQSSGRFADVAASVREARAREGFRRPLEGRCVCVHSGGGKAAEQRRSMERLARAVGARITPPPSADLCVIVGEVGPPRALPAAAEAVGEEWLLQAAERQALPEVAAFRVAR